MCASRAHAIVQLQGALESQGKGQSSKCTGLDLGQTHILAHIIIIIHFN